MSQPPNPPILGGLCASQRIAPQNWGVGGPVVIVGGGPAGATAGLVLAQAGVPVLIVDRAAGPAERPGESLAPSSTPLLRRLGLYEAFLADGPLPSYGNHSAWGAGGRLLEHDFIRDPYGHGWHIDRRRFETTLIAAAHAAGACYRNSTRLIEAARESDAGWRLRLRVNGPTGEETIPARFVIDAGGRGSAFARRQGVRRLHDDRLLGVYAFLSPAGAPAQDSTTLVEATPEGWWYTALLPDGRLATAYFTDPDLLAARRGWTAAAWQALLTETTHTRQRVAAHSYRLTAAPRVAAAGSLRLDRIAGDGWLAAGDAAAAFDPLSSHGIATALWSGLKAAAATLAWLCGDKQALPAYAATIEHVYADYLRLRRAYYADEHRWSGMAFWARRATAPLPRR